ncbi:hypothetical protein AB0I91_13850 [Actinosynnema sp. NPDC049800]
MNDEWQRDDLVDQVNMIMTVTSGPSKPPSYHFPRAHLIHDSIIKALSIHPARTDEKRGVVVSTFLREATEALRANRSPKDLNSARELLGFSRYADVEIESIIKRHKATLPPASDYTHDSKAVRLHLAKLEQLDEPARLAAIETEKPLIMDHRSARDHQKKRWAPLVVDALHDFLYDEKYRDRALAVARKLESIVPNRTKRSMRKLILWAAAGAVAVIFTSLIAYMASRPDEPTLDESRATELESRYDGKDPRGHSGADSKCADPPPSQEVSASKPPVVDPEGKQVGHVELRASPICPVVWARVLWGGDASATYQIPAGWTLHIVSHRPETKTRVDFPEPSNPSPVPYGLGAMLATARGCVYVEVYFSNGDQSTASAKTSCVVAPTS